MKKLLVVVPIIALLLALSIAPALADPVKYATASCDVTLTIERFLSIEITHAPNIVISGGESSGGDYVGFKVKYNFVPCFYEYWCEIAEGMPEAWDLSVPTGSQWCGCYHDPEEKHPCYHNTFDDLTGMHYFPDGMPLGSGGAELTGVRLEDNADDYNNTVIGTLYFEFADGTSPCGD